MLALALVSYLVKKEFLIYVWIYAILPCPFKSQTNRGSGIILILLSKILCYRSIFRIPVYPSPALKLDNPLMIMIMITQKSIGKSGLRSEHGGLGFLACAYLSKHGIFFSSS